jgi:glucose/arabinose dehydrogenase
MRPACITVLLLSAAVATVTAQQNGRPACDPNNAGLTLPAGFCAMIAVDSIRGARHVVVAPNGDVYVAIQNTGRGGGAARGGILALRDGNRDGKFDTRGVDSQSRFGANGGNGIALRGNQLYFATNDAVLRYRLNPGQLVPSGTPDTIVRDLPADRGHTAKSIALGAGNALYVNIGSRTNSCQTQDRENRSPGIDPCVELDTRAGIWQFDANKLNQRQQDGSRYATGLRNMVAITTTSNGVLYGLQHGRDQLAANWGMSDQYNAENPGEILVRINRGDDYGWPYCYFSTDLKQQVLAPEYGGDGQQIGRCAQKKSPVLGFPGHWAPNAIAFYTGRQFPAKYRGGVFAAFHGSWNRAPLPQAGYNVTFTPVANGRPANRYEVFADGFTPVKGQQPVHRPTGLAVAPDGSLYVTDDVGGRIYRIFYSGR